MTDSELRGGLEMQLEMVREKTGLGLTLQLSTLQSTENKHNDNYVFLVLKAIYCCYKIKMLCMVEKGSRMC